MMIEPLSDDLKKIAIAAAIIRSEAGITVEEMFGKLSGEIKKESRLLDCLGITVKMRDLPSWPEHERRRDQLNGTHFFSRLWCRYIRPILNPRLHSHLLGKYEDIKLQTQTELLNEIIKRGSDA